MPKYFCDYCDTYLTHDSPSVRKTHCAGRKHKDNVKFYYEKWYEQNIHKFRPVRPPMPHIPPPGSFSAFDFPPPPITRGLTSIPPPPISGILPTGPPPPMPPSLLLPPPTHLPMPNLMQPPPHFVNDYDKV